ncbi:DNA replication/repair protein RecF [Anaeromyxobacter oryzae]|uniref:DNA replication and repair protein RecF n=1 Tax=Anaeromyxobacter oryzae TaxID=2918170 RepID=A0ABN6MR84_9BACT|nr:DNA replication/repair protein RecF [Anaeromyxobacter oryzae]BDG03519.1 DNA replication and repair protein RecF [Anaeromyxobacter oryzae]
MRLLSLHVQDFRNLAAVELAPSPRATILVGENGQGKTNLLEAVYFLATLKPLRASRLQELVRFGAAHAQVAGDFDGPGGVRRVAVRVEPGGRTALLDGKPQEKLDSYFEGLAAVCFAPDDLLLVKGGPDGRRRFLDRAAFNRWPAVLAEARDYVRALRARNAALRTGTAEVEESFRGPLVRAAARLLVRRRELVLELAPRVQVAFAEISGPGAPEVRFAYRPAHGVRIDGTEAEIAAGLSGILGQRLERDREKGFTSAGPHADELTLALDGKGAKLFGSQGQQRALVLALKIAEIENLRAALGRPPLLLLDDVSSELDPAKNRYLLAYLGGLAAQAFLTTTDRRLLDPAAGPDTAFYRVEKGVVTALVS